MTAPCTFRQPAFRTFLGLLTTVVAASIAVNSASTADGYYLWPSTPTPNVFTTAAPANYGASGLFATPNLPFTAINTMNQKLFGVSEGALQYYLGPELFASLRGTSSYQAYVGRPDAGVGSSLSKVPLANPDPYMDVTGGRVHVDLASAVNTQPHQEVFQAGLEASHLTVTNTNDLITSWTADSTTEMLAAAIPEPSLLVLLLGSSLMVGSQMAAQRRKRRVSEGVARPRMEDG